MNLSQRRPLDVMFLKNSLAALVPALTYITIIIIMIINFPILDKIISYNITDKKSLETAYDRGFSNVSILVKEAKYMGYDYYEDGKQVGSYYYTIIEGKGLLFLVKEKSPSNEIKNYYLKGTIIKNDSSFETITNQLSKDLSILPDELLKILYSGIVSEISYPYSYAVLIYGLVIIPIILVIILIVMNIVYLIYPEKRPSAKQLLAFGSSKEEMLDEINSQIRHSYVFRTKHFIVTKDYIIVHTWMATNIIKISNIEHLSSHKLRRKYLVKKDYYKLIVSNSENMYFEQKFKGMEEIRKIIKYLESTNIEIKYDTVKSK